MSRRIYNMSHLLPNPALKILQEYVRCVRNEEEYVCSVCL